MKYRILAVDDKIENLQPTKQILESWGYTVDAVMSGEEGVTLARNPLTNYAVALLDFKMPGGMNGLEAAAEVKKYSPETIILMYSCEIDRKLLKQTYRAGIHDFIDKDESIDLLKESIEKACKIFEDTRKLKPSNDHSENQAILASIGCVGQSNLLAQAARDCLIFKDRDYPTLIIGESGTGKELFAKAFQRETHTTFIAINCGSFSNGNLFESEVYGYEKGAFTGANQDKKGLFESARGGIIFLDEIHHLEKGTQASLLRAIRYKKIRRVGSNREIDIHCRFIAAAKPEIKEMIKDDRFQLDLYHRFMMHLEIPALRNRKEDIELLVDYFCRKFETENGIRKTFLNKTVRLLEEYDWPGNVAELEGYVNQLLAKCPRDTVGPDMLDERFKREDVISSLTNGISLSDLEFRQEQERRSHIANTLKVCRSKRHAADRLGIGESRLRFLLNQLKIEV
jgi:DNA-binding NtrC family response regulator